MGWVDSNLNWERGIAGKEVEKGEVAGKGKGVAGKGAAKSNNERKVN